MSITAKVTKDKGQVVLITTKDETQVSVLRMTPAQAIELAQKLIRTAK